jgi:cardiolipin synthase (CMP-forming)
MAGHGQGTHPGYPGPMLANWITLSRFPLLLANVLALYLGSTPVRLAGAALLFVGLMLDTVDGMVARRTGQTSLAGSVLDIAADRTYELVLWVCFADLGLIPVAVPLVIIARTTLTDALRSIGVAGGEAPFDQQRGTLGRFLVGSAPMRVSYSASKVVTFCGLAVVQALGAGGPALAWLRATAWVAVALCVLRGVPVILGAARRYWITPAPSPATGGGALSRPG